MQNCKKCQNSLISRTCYEYLDMSQGFIQKDISLHSVLEDNDEIVGQISFFLKTLTHIQFFQNLCVKVGILSQICEFQDACDISDIDN